MPRRSIRKPRLTLAQLRRKDARGAAKARRGLALYRRRKRTMRRRSARTRVPRANTTGTVLVGGRLPTKSVNVVSYADTFTYNLAAITTSKAYFANGCGPISYDQSTTTGNGENADAAITLDRAVIGQARGMDLLDTMYEKYRVLRANISITFTNTSATDGYLWGYVDMETVAGTPSAFGAPSAPDHSDPVTMDGVMNNTIPGFRRVRVNISGVAGSTRTLKLQWTPRRYHLKELKNVRLSFANREGIQTWNNATDGAGGTGDLPIGQFRFGTTAMTSSGNVPGFFSVRLRWEIECSDQVDLSPDDS